jgi:hypothetical protein
MGMLSPEEREKSVKKLQKRLKDIQVLKDSAASGGVLDEQQLAKVAGEKDTLSRIAELQAGT